MHIQMTEWSQSAKGIPPHTFHKVCDKEKNENVYIYMSIYMHYNCILYFFLFMPFCDMIR